ncbi:MAG: AMP-binding protein [Comamonas sp.]
MTIIKQLCSMAELIEARAAERGSEPFMLDAQSGAALSFQQLKEETDRLRKNLEASGLQPGDKVSVYMPNGPLPAILLLAIMASGLQVNPINLLSQSSQLVYVLSHSDTRLVFTCKEYLPSLAQALRQVEREVAVVVCEPESMQVPVVPAVAAVSALPSAPSASSGALSGQQIQADEPALIMYTSGTTGRPKGAMLTHASLLSNGRALTKLWGFTNQDVLLHALPLFHAHGLFISSHCALLSRSRLLFLKKFNAEQVLSLLPRATVMMGVPTFYTRLLDQPEFTVTSAANMRLFVSGSAPLLAETNHDFQRRTGQIVLERYGMTESAIITSNPYVGERRIGSVGKPIDGVEVRIADDKDQLLPPDQIGGIQIRGSGVMKGYWRKPKKTAEEFTSDGWFRTGDQGTLSSDDYLTIVGRAKDLVISGGYNVYPKEVEMAIDALHGVGESAVIGIPDRDFGEAVTAVVVCKNESLTGDQIIKSLKGQLANYKIPKYVYFAPELPRNAMGKVMKNILRDTYKK